MSRFTAIDLTGLTPPNVVEVLDYEAILVDIKNDHVARMQEAGFDFDVGMLESEPAVKVLETAAYRETILRSRVNSAALAILLSYTQKDDLAQIAAYYGVARILISPADLEHEVPAVFEDDERLRRRTALAPEAFSTAGPAGAYMFHVLTLNTAIKDCGVYMSSPGTVQILPLMYEGNGMPSNAVLEAVRLRLAATDIKPLTDVLSVHAPALFSYDINVSLKLADGPDPTLIANKATAALTKYAYDRNMVGFNVYKAGIIAAAKVDGVENVTVLSPTAETIVPGDGGVAYAASITVATT